MKKDIKIENMNIGGKKMNKSALVRQYGCCWETIDRRLNLDKFKYTLLVSEYVNKLGINLNEMNDDLFDKIIMEFITYLK